MIQFSSKPIFSSCSARSAWAICTRVSAKILPEIPYWHQIWISDIIWYHHQNWLGILAAPTGPKTLCCLGWSNLGSQPPPLASAACQTRTTSSATQCSWPWTSRQRVGASFCQLGSGSFCPCHLLAECWKPHHDPSGIMIWTWTKCGTLSSGELNICLEECVAVGYWNDVDTWWWIEWMYSQYVFDLVLVWSTNQMTEWWLNTISLEKMNLGGFERTYFKTLSFVNTHSPSGFLLSV